MTNEDQHQVTSRSDCFSNSSQYDDELEHNIKECFNESQSQLLNITVLQQSANHFDSIATTSSRDSGIPNPSSPSWSSTSVTANQFPDQQSEDDDGESDLDNFPYPSENNFHHITIRVNGIVMPVPILHGKNRQYRSHGRSVHWKDENPSTLAKIKKSGQHILINAGLPYHSKLNLRVQVNRTSRNDTHDNNHIKTVATVERLNSQQDNKHFEEVRQAHYTHNSSVSPIQYEIWPKHRQISIPVSFPIDKRLFLYIQNGDVFARC